MLKRQMLVNKGKIKSYVYTRLTMLNQLQLNATVEIEAIFKIAKQKSSLLEYHYRTAPLKSDIPEHLLSSAEPTGAAEGLAHNQ